MDEEKLQAAIRAEQAAYVREWRRKHPERAKATNRRYWERKALARLEAQAKAEAEKGVKTE